MGSCFIITTTTRTTTTTTTTTLSGDTVLNTKKIECYKVFKEEYSTRNYLHQLRVFNERQILVKFRISNHKLMIELGRYQVDHVTRESRLCPLYESKQVENETHFLFQCQKYSAQRQAQLS